MSPTIKNESTSEVSPKSKTMFALAIVDLKTLLVLGSSMLVTGNKAFSLDATIVD